jgi:hypothetical protein
MPLRNGSRQIATPPVKRTQYTTSSKPNDEEDSTSDPRQASGNYYESEQSPEVTREPSGGRTLSGIDEEIGTLWKLLLELGLQGFDYENLRQRAECITRLQELEREFSNLITPSQADLASPQPPVENPENSETNLNEHSYDRSAQEEVSAPAPGDTPISSIQGEDPKDPRDKMIPIQGRVSHRTVNPSSMPITIAANVTAIPKAPMISQPTQTQDWSEIDHEPAKITYDTAESQGINVDPEAQARLVLAEIAGNCKLAAVTNDPAKIIVTINKLIGNKAIIGPEDNIRSIMTKGYAYMHARRPHVLALQGIG